jgi:hypothetical protein
MSRSGIIFLLASIMALTQCRAYREVVQPDLPVLAGMEGLSEACVASDTIRNVLISKAESLIITGDERYEAVVTLFAVRDSMIYISVVNSGFEIIRAAVDKDSIRVIDRINKIVYSTPVKRRFGYNHPVIFDDVQNLISRYFLCDVLDMGLEPDFDHVIFNFDEIVVKKRISFDRESLVMDRFEFYHLKTNKFLKGEREADGFRILTNFMITEFEIMAKGGTVSYNQNIPVKMEVNRRRYTFINL